MRSCRCTQSSSCLLQAFWYLRSAQASHYSSTPSQQSSVATSSSGCELDADLMMCLPLRPMPGLHQETAAIDTAPSHGYI